MFIKHLIDNHKMCLRRLKLKNLKYFCRQYACFNNNHLYNNLSFEENYTYSFIPTIPHRQIQFNLYNLLSHQSQHHSTGVLLKPHFTNYHSMKKNFTHMQKIVFLFWSILYESNNEPMYIYIKAYNFIIYQLIKNIYSIFNNFEIAFVVSKPYNFLTKKKNV